MQPTAPPVAAAAVGVNVLDFNPILANSTVNTPESFQPKIYQPIGHGVGGNNLEYAYFTVIPNAPVAPVNFANPAIVTPIAHVNDFNIFFPADGHQPTTEEAIRYSCANLDNTQVSPITNWYTQMFGVEQLALGGHIQAGWDNQAGIAPAAAKIIRFDFGEYVQNLANKFPQIIPHAPAPLRLNAVNLVAPNMPIS